MICGLTMLGSNFTFCIEEALFLRASLNRRFRANVSGGKF